MLSQEDLENPCFLELVRREDPAITGVEAIQLAVGEIVERVTCQRAGGRDMEQGIVRIDRLGLLHAVPSLAEIKPHHASRAHAILNRDKRALVEVEPIDSQQGDPCLSPNVVQILCGRVDDGDSRLMRDEEGLAVGCDGDPVWVTQDVGAEKRLQLILVEWYPENGAGETVGEVEIPTR